MKTNTIKTHIMNLITLILITLPISHANQQTINYNIMANPTPYPESDKELERIHNHMWKIARDMSINPDIKRKKLEVGDLSDSYPTLMRSKAIKARQVKETWNPIMLYPTSVWKSCIFPDFKINYVSLCKQKFALSKTQIKLKGCMNNFCLVCCDHLQINFKNIALESQIGKKLLFDSQYKTDNVEYIVTEDEILQCRSACKSHYQIDAPLILPTPPRDPALGTSMNNPAASCSDIKKWGDEAAKSGPYWFDLSERGIHQAFCDMETDGGGWTLFYNYVHLPGQNLILDSTRLPKGLEDNSHMILANVGFTPRDIGELRFYCKEIFKKEKVYWHFKTSSSDFAQVAMNGDQESFRSESLKGSYSEMNPPADINGIFKKVMYEGNVDYYGTSKNGGFTLTPFGSDKLQGYWTIKGQSDSNPKYECGTSHNYLGGLTSPDESPNMVHSHHTIWFRGEPPKDESVQLRLLTKLNK